jgi:hypothetical protein
MRPPRVGASARRGGRSARSADGPRGARVRRFRGALRRGGLAAHLLAATLALGAGEARAQVFLASRPSPEFAIGPLFVRASVGPELGTVPVDVLWSLAVPPTRSALGLEQDLYLVWPDEVQGDPAAADPELVQYLRARGFEVTGRGVLPLVVQDLYPPPGARTAEREVGRAPLVTFRRAGLTGVDLLPAATLVRIPWTPDLVNRTRLLKLRLRFARAIRPKPANWLEEAVRGRRHLVTVSFGDVRSPAVFPLYRENRDRVIPLAAEPSQLLVRFAEAERLRLDEVTPAAASRRPRGGRTPAEVVSLFLDPAAGAAPQALTVHFGYASRMQAWVPILIPLAFFVLGRATGPLIERLARSAGRSLAAHVRLGGSAEPPGRVEGVLLSRDVLGRLAPGRTTAEEVLALCGKTGLEERERFGTPERRTLVYRGRRVVAKRHRRLAWFVAAVSDWELEEQTVEIEVEAGVVRNVEVRVRRVQLPYPDTA